MRDRYLKIAYDYVPHLIQLVDKNQYSPTYGCFDREYWHYRTLDFPCGMSQEFVLPFAMLYANDYPGNKYYKWERMKEIAIAGINFTIKSSYKDGTTDDYFPFERAMGAFVFSLYAITEAYQILKLDNKEMMRFFKTRGNHLIKENESGQLSNHQALAALALYNVYMITGDIKFKEASDVRRDLTLSWQNTQEGWFQEYEGADPGYHTCTIDFLAKLHAKSKDDSLIEPLKKAVEFSWYFMHPDGSYGGEYGSRNTYHFYPHGFELMSKYTDKAGQIADAFLRGLETDKRYHNDDDRMCAHNVYIWLQSWEDYNVTRPANINERENFFRYMPASGMIIKKTDKYYAVINTHKGGVFKAFNNNNCIASDTGIIGELENGKVVVSHLMNLKNKVNVEENKISIKGKFSFRRAKLSSPIKIIVFRIWLLLIGRFKANLTRTIVQKLLITYKSHLNIPFKRDIILNDENIEVVDSFEKTTGFKRISAGSDATSIYVANSNVFQESVVRIPWSHMPEDLLSDIRKKSIQWKRVVSA